MERWPGRKPGRPPRAGLSTICSTSAAEFCTGERTLKTSRHPPADPEELECQRSDGTQTLLNPVLREIPGPHASKRPSRQPPQKRTPGSSALPTNCSAQLRIANSGSHRDIIRRDLGHFNNLLRIRRERAEDWQLVPHLRHRCIEEFAPWEQSTRSRRCAPQCAAGPAPVETRCAPSCPSSPALAIF